MVNKMETQIKQRMDGLMDMTFERKFKTVTQDIIKDLKQEGFDSNDIYEYIVGMVEEAGK